MTARVFLIICIILLTAIIGFSVYSQNEHKPTEEESIADRIINAKAKLYANGVPLETPLVLVCNPLDINEYHLMWQAKKHDKGCYIEDMKLYGYDGLPRGSFYIMQAENFDETKAGVHKYY